MTRRRRIGFAMLALWLFILTGCWSRTELKDINLVLGIGVDRTAGGLLVTAQFPIAAKLTGAAGGQRGGGSQTTYTASVKGITMRDADHRLVEVLPGRIDWSHLQVTVIGEDLAREGIAPLADFLLRAEPVPELTQLVVARQQKAADIVKLTNPLEPLPPLGIVRTLKAMQRESMVVDPSLIRFVDAMGQPGVDAMLPSIEVAPDGVPRLGPLAVFKGDRLVGWLTEDETLGVGVVRIKSPHLFVLLPCHEGEPPGANVEVHSHEWKITVHETDGRLEASIDVKARGQLIEDACLGDIMQPATRREMERLGAEQIRKDIEAAVQRSKDLRADIFGFGREVYRHMPAEWMRRQDHWDEELTQLPVSVSVQLTIDETGVITKPILPK